MDLVKRAVRTPAPSMETKTVLRKIVGQLRKIIPTYTHSIKNIADLKDGTEYMNRDVRNHRWFGIIPDAIRDTIERDDIRRVHELRLHIGGRQIHVHLTYFSDVSPEKVSGDMRKVSIWFTFISLYAPIHCSSELMVHLFFTPHKKQVPDATDIEMNKHHINTAFTSQCDKSTTIFLYRAEEWYKVLMHETFHCMGMDFSHMDSGPADKQITALFPGCDPHLNVRLFETYCEIWANILHSIFSVVLSTKRNAVSYKHKPYTNGGKTRRHRDGGDIVAGICRALKVEQAFAVFQCVKVLRHQGIVYSDLLTVSPDKRPKYTETTQVFAYHVLRPMLFMRLNQFMRWCIDHNGARLVSFVHTVKNVHSYGLMVTHVYKSPDWLNTVARMQRVFDSIPATDPIMQTLRMTYYTIDESG